MKRFICLPVLIGGAGSSAIGTPLCVHAAPSYSELDNLYLYTKFGGGVGSTENGEALVGGGVGIGAYLGTRFGWDLSAGGYIGDNLYHSSCLAYGRALGLFYLFPRCNLSPCIGAGLGLGVIDQGWRGGAAGLLGAFAVGLEWFRGKSFYVSSSSDNYCSYSKSTFPLLFFLELAGHQPTSGDGHHSPALIPEFGIGF